MLHGSISAHRRNKNDHKQHFRNFTLISSHIYHQTFTKQPYRKEALHREAATRKSSQIRDCNILAFPVLNCSIPLCSLRLAGYFSLYLVVLMSRIFASFTDSQMQKQKGPLPPQLMNNLTVNGGERQ